MDSTRLCWLRTKAVNAPVRQTAERTAAWSSVDRPSWSRAASAYGIEIAVRTA
jgi:hypothetical protein